MRKFLSAFSLTILLSTTANAAVIMKDIEYLDGKTKLKGTLAFDDSITTPRPAIVAYPEWWGHNEYIKKRAAELAAEGYIVFAADMYGSNKITIDPKQATEWSKPFYSNRKLMQSRARAAITALKAQPNVDINNIAAVGFCFGGTVALELARAGEDLKGVASFHGGLQFTSKPAEGAVKAKVLVMNGAADPMVPAADRQKFMDEMEAAKADYQFIEYSGAVHAFTNPDADKFGIPGVGYNAAAEKRSFAALHRFLSEVF
jgi:dienelactone hydrolase